MLVADRRPIRLRRARPKAIVTDIDGTITTTRHHLPRGDQPVPQMIRLLKGYKDKGYAVVVLTARKHSERALTLRQLRRWGVPFDLLVTRALGDTESPALYKLHAFRRLIEPFYEVHVALDDKANCWSYLGIHRPNLVRLRSLGARAYQYIA